jgi:glycosyltransferase involved in cell wall biosynthesis
MKFSLLMSVYFNEKIENLNELFVSIKNQTLIHDEFVIIVDGKINNNLHKEINLFKEYDKKTKVYYLDKNVGLAKALNFGLLKVSNEITLRCDSDDIYLPKRNEKMINLFKLFPNLVLAGAYVQEFSKGSDYVFTRKTPININLIKKKYVLSNPFNHPSVAFKKSIILKNGGYPKIYPEDWLLWGKIIYQDYEFCNLPEILVKMRVGKDFQNRRGLKQLPGEIKAIYFGMMENKSLINYIYGSISIIIRVIVRLLPANIRAVVYKLRK